MQYHLLNKVVLSWRITAVLVNSNTKPKRVLPKGLTGLGIKNLKNLIAAKEEILSFSNRIERAAVVFYYSKNANIEAFFCHKAYAKHVFDPP